MKNKFLIIITHILSLVIFEIICYIIVEKMYLNLDIIDISLKSSIIAGKIHFCLSLIEVIYALVSKKISEEYKRIIYLFPIISFYLPLFIGFNISYVLIKYNKLK